jgi:hypothetical protein
MTPEKFKQLLKEFAPKKVITEEEVIPIGPDGQKITDRQVISNLNLAIKQVAPGLRPKLIALITDPEAANALKTTQQQAAIIGAIAVTFGITADEFNQVIPKVKNFLRNTSTTPNENPKA